MNIERMVAEAHTAGAASRDAEVATLRSEVAAKTAEVEAAEREIREMVDGWAASKADRERLTVEVAVLRRHEDAERERTKNHPTMCCGQCADDIMAARSEVEHERETGNLLVGTVEAHQAIEAKILAVTGPPSGGHDVADEVLGLLRVAQGARDDAWSEVARLTAECDARRAGNAQDSVTIRETRALADRLAGALRKSAGVLSGADLSKSCLIDALEAARAALKDYEEARHG